MNSKNSKQKKAYYKLLSMNAVFIIILLLILNIFSKDKVFSEKENRTMAKKPKLSFSNFLNGTITSEFESYVSDQFIFRNKFIDLKTNTDKLLGKNQFNGVYKCKDNYLISPFEQPKKDNIVAKEKCINNFFSKNEKLVNRLMIVPNKCAILKDKLPCFAPSYDEEKYINDFYNAIGIHGQSINLMPTFMENCAKPLFYRTDHHWTTLGAYYGYREYCHSINEVPNEESNYNVLEVSQNFFGSLYSKASFNSIKPDNINIYMPKYDENFVVTYGDTKKKSTSLYDSKALKTQDKYKVFTQGNHSLMKIRTEAKNKSKLLLIKDSYANCFLPFLTSHFDNIFVVDLRYYTEDVQDLIEDYDITHTLILYNGETFFQDDSILNLSYD